MIESLFVALNAIPTEKVLRVVRADELNDVVRYAIATFTTFDCGLFCHTTVPGENQLWRCSSILPSKLAIMILIMNQSASVSKTPR